MKVNKRLIQPDDLLNKTMAIQVVGKGDYFRDYSEALCDCFNKKNIFAERFEDIQYDEKWDVVFIVSPNVKMRKKIHLLRRNKKVIICALLTEQPCSREVGFWNTGSGMVKRERSLLKYYDLVFVWSKEQYELYNQYHKRVIHFPHSYYPKIDYTEKFKNVEKKYDILFLGEGALPHREKIIRLLKSRYKVLDTSTRDIQLWGEEKYRAIAESKICINLHQESGLIMESPRLYDYFANRAFVLSETMRWSEPFEIEQDYDVFYYSNVLDKIEFYLEHDEERSCIAENAYCKVRSIDMNSQIIIIIDAILMELNYKKYKRDYLRNQVKRLRKIKWYLYNYREIMDWK